MLEEHLKGLNCISTRYTLLYDFSAGWEKLFATLTRLCHIFLKVPVKHLAVILINYPYQVNPTQHCEAQPAQLKVPSHIPIQLCIFNWNKKYYRYRTYLKTACMQHPGWEPVAWERSGSQRAQTNSLRSSIPGNLLEMQIISPLSPFYWMGNSALGIMQFVF